MTGRRREPERILNRRALLGGGAALVAAPARAGSLRDLDHIIVLMKENRSFDHYFGTLSGVRGFADPAALPGVFAQADPFGPGAPLFPFHLDTRTTAAQRLPDLDHSRTAQQAALDGGRMDGWIASLARRHGAKARFTMGYLRRDDLPFYHALADAFTICDRYHAGVLGPTHPNRIMLMTGTVDAVQRHGRAALDNRGRDYRFETYPERLSRAGISWRVHHDSDDFDCNVLKFFRQYQDAPQGSALHEATIRDRSFESLLDDLARGDIPHVLWVVPPAAASEHPPYLPAAGEHHTAQLLRALWANPTLWARTAVILNWDENDGLFDHVPPPLPQPDTADEWADGLPVGLGFRVPCLVISPWTRGGCLCPRVFDHSSVLRLLESRFGVEAAGISAWRRAVSGDLVTAFDFGSSRLDLPALPDTAAALARAEQAVATLPAPDVVAARGLPAVEAGMRRRRG
jgi:phospholipase C